MDENVDQAVSWVTVYGMHVLGAIVILVIGWLVAGIARRSMVKVLRRTDTDEAIVAFAGSLVRILILVFAVIAALARFGVETTSLVAVLGAVGFAIGFALQGSLGNFAAGILVLTLRPFRVGDYIDAAGVAGSVKEIQLFNTILATPDNVKLIVPNGQIYGNVIKNYAGYDTRRIDFVFGIGYGSSMEKAIGILEKVLKEEGRILDDPAPQIAVAELADSSVNFVVRPWVKKEDYWSVKFDVTRKVKEEFDANGIEIPFPQRTVHMVSQAEAS